MCQIDVFYFLFYDVFIEEGIESWKVTFGTVINADIFNQSQN
jgi:hypothetical protein